MSLLRRVRRALALLLRVLMVGFAVGHTTPRPPPPPPRQTTEQVAEKR
jgi:hypothetical protein